MVSMGIPRFQERENNRDSSNNVISKISQIESKRNPNKFNVARLYLLSQVSKLVKPMEVDKNENMNFIRHTSIFETENSDIKWS